MTLQQPTPIKIPIVTAQLVKVRNFMNIIINDLQAMPLTLLSYTDSKDERGTTTQKKSHSNCHSGSKIIVFQMNLSTKSVRKIDLKEVETYYNKCAK